MGILLMLGAVALGAAVWLWILRLYDRVEPEAVRYLVEVALIGGTLSVFFATIVNEGVRLLLEVDLHLLLGSASEIPLWRLVLLCAAVGIVEEVCKALATVLLARSIGDLDEPVDAMIYAMTVGLGFASIENILYAARFGTDVLLIRFLWPMPAHMAYAAVWGYGLAKLYYVRNQTRGKLEMVAWVGLAAAAHGTANLLLFLDYGWAPYGSLLVLGLLGWFAHRHLVQLEAESPFLVPGECPFCRHRNAPQATTCESCGEHIAGTDMFEACPCGEVRIPVGADPCPACDVPRRDRLRSRSTS